MTEEQKQIISSAMDVLPPMEIKNPSGGFNGYLLRTSAEPVERGNSTFIVKQPGSDYTFELLPDNMDKRVELRKSWYGKTDSKGFYISILVEPNGDSFNELLEVLDEIDEEDYVDYVKELTEELIRSFLSSFEPFAAVWHMHQFGKGVFRPPHVHILLKKVRRLTKEQNDVIVKNNY